MTTSTTIRRAAFAALGLTALGGGAFVGAVLTLSALDVREELAWYRKAARETRTEYAEGLTALAALGADTHRPLVYAGDVYHPPAR